MYPNACVKENQEVEKISLGALKTILGSNAEVVLLDARTAKWDDGKRIPGALSLTNEDHAEKFHALIPNKDALIIVYCSHAQCGASSRLAKRLKELGYGCILKYAEGIEEWIANGNPVTTS